MSETTRIKKYIVIYDICVKDNSNIEKRNSIKRRTKIMRILFEYGIRTQLSVFEIEINSLKEKEKLIKKLKRYLRLTTDKLFIYPIDEKSFLKIKRYGNFERTLLRDFFL